MVQIVKSAYKIPAFQNRA
uniref:Uncharacterized protein n=1 Tax=Arundo donax TaxID=35708 RepID=A0A0A8YGW6_ARUDO